MCEQNQQRRIFSDVKSFLGYLKEDIFSSIPVEQVMGVVVTHSVTRQKCVTFNLQSIPNFFFVFVVFIVAL